MSKVNNKRSVAIKKGLDDMREQRDELLAALEVLIDHADMLQSTLPKAQSDKVFADILAARAAIVKVKG